VPAAGAGGAAVSLWALRRAGLAPLAAARTLLTFLVVLYSVFLASIALSGAALTFGLVRAGGPTLLSAIPAGAGLLCTVIAISLASRGAFLPDAGRVRESGRSRIGVAAQRLGGAVRDASGLVRGGDPRLLGAVAAWAFDAAVVWAMLHAFGSAPAIAVLVPGYFVGQAANTLPIPGAVSGGIAGVLIAFAIPAAAAPTSVPAYRAIAVWLPSGIALATLPGLRATIARWERNDLRSAAAQAARNNPAPVMGIRLGWGRYERRARLVAG
jgi:putative heme transporter